MVRVNYLKKIFKCIGKINIMYYKKQMNGRFPSHTQDKKMKLFCPESQFKPIDKLKAYGTIYLYVINNFLGGE